MHMNQLLGSRKDECIISANYVQEYCFMKWTKTSYYIQVKTRLLAVNLNIDSAF